MTDRRPTVDQNLPADMRAAFLQAQVWELEDVIARMRGNVVALCERLANASAVLGMAAERGKVSSADVSRIVGGEK